MLSCVICVRDGARFIGEAIDSAQAALEPDDEILVIDDGSRDDTPAVSAAAVAPGKARVRVCSGPPEGIVAARNRGLAEVKGDLLVFLDHDDRFDSQGLTRLRMYSAKTQLRRDLWAVAELHRRDLPARAGRRLEDRLFATKPALLHRGDLSGACLRNGRGFFGSLRQLPGTRLDDAS